MTYTIGKYTFTDEGLRAYAAESANLCRHIKIDDMNYIVLYTCKSGESIVISSDLQHIQILEPQLVGA